MAVAQIQGATGQATRLSVASKSRWNAPRSAGHQARRGGACPSCMRHNFIKLFSCCYKASRVLMPTSRKLLSNNTDITIITTPQSPLHRLAVTKKVIGTERNLRPCRAEIIPHFTKQRRGIDDRHDIARQGTVKGPRRLLFDQPLSITRHCLPLRDNAVIALSVVEILGELRDTQEVFINGPVGETNGFTVGQRPDPVIPVADVFEKRGKHMLQYLGVYLGVKRSRRIPPAYTEILPGQGAPTPLLMEDDDEAGQLLSRERK